MTMYVYKKNINCGGELQKIAQCASYMYYRHIQVLRFGNNYSYYIQCLNYPIITEWEIMFSFPGASVCGQAGGHSTGASRTILGHTSGHSVRIHRSAHFSL